MWYACYRMDRIKAREVADRIAAGPCQLEGGEGPR